MFNYDRALFRNGRNIIPDNENCNWKECSEFHALSTIAHNALYLSKLYSSFSHTSRATRNVLVLVTPSRGAFCQSVFRHIQMTRASFAKCAALSGGGRQQPHTGLDLRPLNGQRISAWFTTSWGCIPRQRWSPFLDRLPESVLLICSNTKRKQRTSIVDNAANYLSACV